MEVLYCWNEGGIPISCGVAAANLKILACDGKRSEGTVCINDRLERRTEEIKWVAVLSNKNSRPAWIVSRARPTDDEAVYIDCQTKEPEFTPSSSGNKRIKVFIALHLEAFLKGKKIDLAILLMHGYGGEIDITV
jgi:hypothetical protein